MGMKAGVIIKVFFLIISFLVVDSLCSLNQTHINGTNYFIYRLSGNATFIKPIINRTSEESAADGRTFNAWSILWYVGSFVGLILFFFLISFSEWCCKRRLWFRRQRSDVRDATTSISHNSRGGNDPSPPAYDQFAPPSYESIYDKSNKNKDDEDEKAQFEVYVVPLNSGREVVEQLMTNAGGNVENDLRGLPPSYSSATDLRNVSGGENSGGIGNVNLCKCKCKENDKRNYGGGKD